jgi:ParB/RepB/Spo0J family partition protein
MTRVKQQELKLPLAKIAPGRNVRVDLANIDSLARSIEIVGLLQPLIVVPVDVSDPTKGVEVIAGHRRLAACQQIGYDPVECHLRARGNERWRLHAQLAENLERERMTQLEQAQAFGDLIKQGMTTREVAEAFGFAQASVAKKLQLLTYPKPMQRAVHTGHITLSDCLSVPLDIANAYPAETLREKCAAGGASLRSWSRRMVTAARTGGREVKQTNHTDHMTLAIDGALGEEVRAAAAAERQTIGEWVGKACRARLKQSRKAAS